MTELVLIGVALMAAATGYYEAAKVEQQDGCGPWGLTPSVCGLACVVIGFLGAVVFEPVVVGAIVGVVGYNELIRYEELRQERLAGKPARLWSIGLGMLAVVGTMLTSVVVVGGVSLVAGLASGLLLMKADRDELIEVNNTLRQEKDELIAEKRSAAAERSKRPATPEPAPARTDNYSNAVAAALRAEHPKPSANNVVPLTVHTGSDLLPRTPSAGAGGNDLLPSRR
jgi:hypothetical protein